MAQDNISQYTPTRVPSALSKMLGSAKQKFGSLRRKTASPDPSNLAQTPAIEDRDQGGRNDTAGAESANASNNALPSSGPLTQTEGVSVAEALDAHQGKTYKAKEDKKKADDEMTVVQLEAFPVKHEIVKVETEAHANEVLKDIRDGEVGFDTEFTDRRPTEEEKMIDDRIPRNTALRKTAILGWQIGELGTKKPFPIAWNNIGVRLIQIARGNLVWVMDMWKIRALPVELKRILVSPDIKKTGGGVIRDLSIIWDDLRLEMRNLVDDGMMTKLLFAEKYHKMAYGNLALQTCVEDVFGFALPKDLSNSDWTAKELSEAQIECKLQTQPWTTVESGGTPYEWPKSTHMKWADTSI
ncbi:ribonuclease H-like domain-containing protein [Mycena latifolia]|nr:ribonuclease H-like domain-containing protein [Mycena latifolia]